MKVFYSELKRFIPSLKASAKQVADALTLIGLMTDSMTEVKIGGKRDWLLDLEVRQNRPDYLGVIGVARDAAAYFGIPLVLPNVNLKYLDIQPDVKISDVKDIKRVCVVRVGSLDNTKSSPPWLKDSLNARGINSVNLLVDLSNLAMVITGFPNHFFDADEVMGALVWQRASESKQLISLDGTALNINKGKELVICDNLGPLVLASAVGGKRSAVSKSTKSVLIEAAVYDPLKMRQDARGLEVVTEASTRLEKTLSQEGVLWALQYTVFLLAEHFSNIKVSKIFDYYPKSAHYKPRTIKFNTDLSSKVSGVEITHVESENVLKHLGFEVKLLDKNKLLVRVPAWRSDVEGEMDLVEEVLRTTGFDKVPSHTPAFQWIQDVTPKRLKLEDRLRESLVTLGFDEILTLPLITSEMNKRCYVGTGRDVRTQNAINEEMPVLRQTLISGLLSQQQEYALGGVTHSLLFEVGKVFSRKAGNYVEEDHLGLLLQWQKVEGALVVLQNNLNLLLRQLGATEISFRADEMPPPVAVPGENFQLMVGKVKVGVLYQAKSLLISGNRTLGNTACAELDIDLLVKALISEHPRGVKELLGKLVVLDANLEISGEGIERLHQRLSAIKRKIGARHLWSAEVTDTFEMSKQLTRYTVRFAYQGLTDKEAKKAHDAVTVIF